MTEHFTPEEDARVSLESYNDAMRAIGERVKAGAQVPAFLQSNRDAGGHAMLGGRVLMVQTQIPHHAAWHSAVRDWAPKTPFFDVSPIGGRA